MSEMILICFTFVSANRDHWSDVHRSLMSWLGCRHRNQKSSLHMTAGHCRTSRDSQRSTIIAPASLLFILFSIIPSAKVPPTKYWLVNRTVQTNREDKVNKILVVLVVLIIDVQILDYWVLGYCFEPADKEHIYNEEKATLDEYAL